MINESFKHICSILVGYKHFFLTFFTFEFDLRKLTMVGSLIAAFLRVSVVHCIATRW